MNKRYELIGSGAGVFLTAIQTHQTFQLISLILTIIATAFSMGFTVYSWYKKSKEDGKIDKNEVEEVSKIIDDHLKDINNNVDKYVENVEKSEKDGKT